MSIICKNIVILFNSTKREKFCLICLPFKSKTIDAAPYLFGLAHDNNFVPEEKMTK